MSGQFTASSSYGFYSLELSHIASSTVSDACVATGIVHFQPPSVTKAPVHFICRIADARTAHLFTHMWRVEPPTGFVSWNVLVAWGLNWDESFCQGVVQDSASSARRLSAPMPVWSQIPDSWSTSLHKAVFEGHLSVSTLLPVLMCENTSQLAPC
jgi:hypothetical protein